MKHIRVLGFDCAACRKAHARIAEVAAGLGADIRLEKVDDPRELVAARVLVPPGVVVDGRLVYSGGVPDRKLIESWLAQPAPEEHASFVFLLDSAGGVHPLPHGLYVELAKGEATAPEFSGQQMRVADWYVRLEGGMPVALVNETHALLTFDAEGRVDWAATPSFHPHRDSEVLASESASLPSPQERERMLELVFGLRPEA
jgi:hypothetical protein